MDDWPLIRIHQRAEAELRNVRDLVLLEGSVNYTWLVWRAGLRILVPYTMKSVLARLPATEFVRCHRQFAVNRRYIDKAKLLSDRSRVYLTTGEIELPIARRRRTLLYHQLVKANSARLSTRWA
ncbi:LytR/AlgR family response regulator transcription factor [Spirosoma pulveris]